MKSLDHSCDVLVVGHGAAGCLVGLWLAASGLDVIIIGRGITATALSTGRIELTGAREADKLAGYLKEVGRASGLYQGLEGRRIAVTNCGTVRYQELTSAHDWCLAPDQEAVAVLGFAGNPDLDPDLACAALREAKAGISARPYWTALRLPCPIPTGSGPHLSDEAEEAVGILSEVIAELSEGTVVIPPMFDGPNYCKALEMMERSSGRRVVEPATPLSAPGRRLQQCLEREATRAGCRLLADRELIGLEIDGRTARHAVGRSGLREFSVEMSTIVLAAGNLTSGGLSVVGQDAVDPLGLFATEVGRGRSLASSELTRTLSTGISNRESRAVARNGDVLGNVFVAGSMVPGMSFPLGRGLGHVMSNALAVARRVREAL